MRRKWIFLVPLAIFGVFLFVAIGGEVVRQLWNWLLPTIFGSPRITFWQALGLLALCRILFGGFGHGGSHRSHRTPEERNRIRQRIGERFGFGSPTRERQEAPPTGSV